VEQRNEALPGSPADRLFQLNGQAPAPKARASGSLFERFWPRCEQCACELDAACKEKEAAGPALRKLFDQYEERRRETAKITAAVRSAAEPLNALRDRLTMASGCVALLAAMLGALALARGQGNLGAAPYFIGAMVSCGLAVYLAIDSNRHPAQGEDDVVFEVVMPAQPEAIKTAAPKLPPLPHDTIEAPSTERSEPIRFMGFSIPNPTRINPKRPVAAARVPSRSIPGHLFEPVSTLPGTRAPLAESVFAALRAADKAAIDQAASYRDAHAMSLLEKIEAALAGQKSDAADRVRSALPRTAPLIVREYAAPRPGSRDSAELDGDTVLWKPVIVLPTDGKTTLRFHLGNAPGYEVIVAGHTPDGRIGSVRTFLPVAPAK
jgi:hypothetical protein